MLSQSESESEVISLVVSDSDSGYSISRTKVLRLQFMYKICRFLYVKILTSHNFFAIWPIWPIFMGDMVEMK